MANKKSSGWMTALKQWNSGHNAWCIPRKGTEQYGEVVSIMNKDKNKSPEETKKKAGAFLGNVMKSRLVEEKHLKNITKDKPLLMAYNEQKTKNDKEFIAELYKKNFNKDLNINPTALQEQVKVYKGRLAEKEKRNKK